MKKYIYSVLTLTLFIIGGTYLKSQSKAEYGRIFVSFGSFHIPFVEATIQGKAYPFKINLDWTLFPLYLGKDVLSQIDKKSNGLMTIDVNNDQIEVLTYLIPKIEIGDLVYYNVLAMEFDEDNQAAMIGLKFFEDQNLLLDFPNSTIITCNDLNKLKQVGYFIEEMTKAPCEVGRKGLIVAADTDLGLVKLGVSSINAWSIMRLDLAREKIMSASEKQFLTTSSFKIGERDFGCKDFYLYDLSPATYKADGCIGMDFLKNHILYFNFRSKTVYIDQK